MGTSAEKSQRNDQCSDFYDENKRKENVHVYEMPSMQESSRSEKISDKKRIKNSVKNKTNQRRPSFIIHNTPNTRNSRKQERAKSNSRQRLRRKVINQEYHQRFDRGYFCQSLDYKRKSPNQLALLKEVATAKRHVAFMSGNVAIPFRSKEYQVKTNKIRINQKKLAGKEQHKPLFLEDKEALKGNYRNDINVMKSKPMKLSRSLSRNRKQRKGVRMKPKLNKSGKTITIPMSKVSKRKQSMNNIETQHVILKRQGSTDVSENDSKNRVKTSNLVKSQGKNVTFGAEYDTQLDRKFRQSRNALYRESIDPQPNFFKVKKKTQIKLKTEPKSHSNLVGGKTEKESPFEIFLADPDPEYKRNQYKWPQKVIESEFKAPDGQIFKLNFHVEDLEKAIEQNKKDQFENYYDDDEF